MAIIWVVGCVSAKDKQNLRSNAVTMPLNEGRLLPAWFWGAPGLLCALGLGCLLLHLVSSCSHSCLYAGPSLGFALLLVAPHSWGLSCHGHAGPQERQAQASEGFKSRFLRCFLSGTHSCLTSVHGPAAAPGCWRPAALGWGCGNLTPQLHGGRSSMWP